MRTGAIFARGSCRALKWMAMLGVVFALGAGSAAAQITVEAANKGKVTEGGSLTLTVKVTADRAAGVLASADVVVEAQQATGSTTPAATTAQTAETQDVIFNPASTTINFPARQSDDPAADVEMSGTITLQTSDDPDAEDEVVEVIFTITNAGNLTEADGSTPLAAPAAATPVTIEDDETQTYVLMLNPGETPKEGGDFDLTLKADPGHVDDSVALRLHLSDPMYELDATSAAGVSLGNVTPDDGADATEAENMAPITVEAPDNDENRSDDTLTIRLLATATSKELGMADFEVADAHMLPAVKVMVVDDDGKALDPQPDSIMEGDTVKIMVTAVDKDGKDKKAGEALMVSLTPTGTAGMRDYSLSAHPIAIANGKASSAAVGLTAAADNEVDMETLMFDATVAGEKGNGTETRDTRACSR